MTIRLPRRRLPLNVDAADRAAPPDARTCIVHIVRSANGIAPFRAFLEAMQRFPPGVDYEIVFAMKGFSAPSAAAPYLALAARLGIHAKEMYFPDAGLDLGVYFAAASQLRRERYCFLNSFSEPLLPGWLRRLDDALGRDNVGVAGATGAWTSSQSWLLYGLRLPSAYSTVLPPRQLVSEQSRRMDEERASLAQAAHPRQVAARRVTAIRGLPIASVRALGQLPAQLRHFEPFPAHHVRTNAFVVAHSTLAQLRLREVRSKAHAYMLESGKDSITRQVERLGMRAVVVDSDGEIYGHDHWHESRTFFQGSQERLLVSDNQTRFYTRGDADRRRVLAAMAWGHSADPSA